MKRLGKGSDRGDNGRVDVSPMIDMVFILLIFFVVAAVFVQEQGVAAESMVHGSDGSEQQLVVSIDAQGAIWTGGNSAVSIPTLTRQVQEAKTNGLLSVTVEAHPTARAARVIDVMDAVRLGGVDNPITLRSSSK